MSQLNICYVIYVLLRLKYWLVLFLIILVLILFKFKKCPNIFRIRVVLQIWMLLYILVRSKNVNTILRNCSWYNKY